MKRKTKEQLTSEMQKLETKAIQLQRKIDALQNSWEAKEDTLKALGQSLDYNWSDVMAGA